MDSEQDRELELIRDQMHQTRASLADKLGTLESQVRGTVESATEAVTTTVEGVKEVVSNVTEVVQDTVEAVSDTVENVTDTVSSVASAFDVSAHVQNAPLTSVGCSIAVGLLGGYCLGNTKRPANQPTASFHGAHVNGNGWAATHPAPAAPQPAPEEIQSNGLSGMLSQAASSARSLGVTALMSTVSQLARKYLPDMARDEACKLLSDFSLKLGGRALPRPPADNINT